eukprot:6196480-Pleurochrysis_carterae.AAC.4
MSIKGNRATGCLAMFFTNQVNQRPRGARPLDMRTRSSESQAMLRRASMSPPVRSSSVMLAISPLAAALCSAVASVCAATARMARGAQEEAEPCASSGEFANDCNSKGHLEQDFGELSHMLDTTRLSLHAIFSRAHES